MARHRLPFHSRHQLVYHTNHRCVHAMRILPADRIMGRGDGVECLNCQHLNRAGSQSGSWQGRLRRFFSCRQKNP